PSRRGSRSRASRSGSGGGPWWRFSRSTTRATWPCGGGRCAPGGRGGRAWWRRSDIPRCSAPWRWSSREWPWRWARRSPSPPGSLERPFQAGLAARSRGWPGVRRACGGRGVGERLLKGIGVSPGIAIGPARVVRSTLPEVPAHVVPRSQVSKEVRRLRAAVSDVRRHLLELKATAEERAGADEARIFDAQILMLEDKEFLAGVEGLIRENHLTAEKAYEFK